MQRNHNFSIKPNDHSALQLVKELRIISIQKGISFSYMCIEGLRLYKKQIIDKKENANE